MDAIVAGPYGLGQAQKDKNHALTRTIEEKLLSVLRAELNGYHRTSHSARYWRIVLGHWLRRYVDVIFNRYHSLKQCLENYPISGTSVLSSESCQLAVQDTSSFIWASNDDTWNNILYMRILEHLPGQKLTVDSVKMESGYTFRMPEDGRSVSLKGRFIDIVRRRVEIVTNWFARSEDCFIINSYLPLVDEWKLQASLGQIPTLHCSRTPMPIDADRNLRERFTKRAMGGAVKGFSGCIGALLFELLPTCYLEGYGALCAQTKKLPWPERPRFIFTSNNFDTDEVFKCWAAGKAEEKIPYYTGQHGNNYGTHRYANPSVEEVTADKFLTWGWTDGLAAHTPAFVFKAAGKKRQTHNPMGGLLLVEVHLNHRVTTWDGYAEFKTYFDEQQSFVNKLSRACRNALTIRLHSASKMFRWSEEARWREFDADLIIDLGSRPIHDLTAENRLVVHSYDSTGILEMLSQDVPTIAFWQDGFSHLRESAKPYYQQLVDAGIVHLTPEFAATHVNMIWDDVASWWEGDKVQSARRRFCDRYARISAQPIRDLKRILTNTNNA